MSFSATDLAALDTILRAAARAEVLPRFRHLAPNAVHEKTGPQDLVTEADLAAEAAITAALAARFPGATIVGEEATAADPTLLDRLDGAGLSFVVDPVDGTANFAAGLAVFAMMAAAIIGGQVVGAVIHDPLAGDSALALAGGGAWLRRRRWPR